MHFHKAVLLCFNYNEVCLDYLSQKSEAVVDDHVLEFVKGDQVL